jgi:hypothetical protein
MASLQRNVAGQHVKFLLVGASTGNADASATVTVYVTKDSGSQASGGGTVTNLGHGQYDYEPTQAETDATDVGFLFTASSDIPVHYDFHPDVVDANGFPSVNVADTGGSTLQGAAGYVGIDWSKVTNATSTVNLSGTTVGTLTTYTGNTPQTGDAYAIVHSGSYGNAALLTAIDAIPTDPYTGTPPTTAQIATAVWQDLMSSSDFGTSGSIGALLKADINAPIGSIPTNPYTGTPPTAAQIATAVLTDTTSGDLGTSGSLGYIIAHQLGGTFTSSSSSVFSSNSLANAPSGGGSFPQNFSALQISAAGIVEADIYSVNGTEVTGSGTSGSPWGPG